MTVAEQLRPYQRGAVDFICDHAGAALFFEQGTGKTWVIAGAIERLLGARDRFTGACVVPLANLETTWVRTLARIEGLKVCRTLDELRATPGHRLLLLNYERVRPVIKKLRKISWTLFAYDESQRLKARGSKQSRDAARLVSVEHRVLLSGTPIEQCPQDLWAQFRFALPHVLGPWSEFEAQWFTRTGYMGYELKFVQRRLPELLALIEPHIMRVLKSEVLDLEPVTYVREPVELLGLQSEVYDAVTEQMLARVDGGTVTCDRAITQLIRQQQICGGFVRLDPTPAELAEASARARRTGRPPRTHGRLVHLGDAKLRRLKAILRRDPRRPVVIFCKYREERAGIERALAALGVSHGVIAGGVKGSDRAAIVDAFQRGELEALVCQTKAGGVGLDLQTACVGVMYSTTWSWIDFDQAVSRLDRSGQLNPVTIYLIFAKNTVDRDIYTALLMKKNVAELILNRKSKIMAKPAPAVTAKSTPKPAAAAAPAAEKAKPTPPPQPPKPKYGVPELAEVMQVKASSVRVRLRSASIPKAGKLYGWDTKTEMMDVVAQLKANSGRKAKDGPKTEESDEAE